MNIIFLTILGAGLIIAINSFVYKVSSFYITIGFVLIGIGLALFVTSIVNPMLFINSYFL